MKFNSKHLSFLGTCGLSLALFTMPVSTAFADDKAEGQSFCGNAAQVLMGLTGLPETTVLQCVWQESGKIMFDNPANPDVHVLTLFSKNGDAYENLGTLAVSKDGTQWWLFDMAKETFAPIAKENIPEKWWRFDAIMGTDEQNP